MDRIATRQSMAQAVAPLIGAEIASMEPGPYGVVTLVKGDIGLNFRWDDSHLERPTRLRISAYIANALRNDPLLRGISFPEIGEMRAAVSRAPDVIAREIERKLLDPRALETVAGARARLDSLKVRRASVESAVASYQAAFPALKVELKEGETEARFTLNGKNGCYLYGRIIPEGRMYVDRLSLETGEHARALLNIVAGD